MSRLRALLDASPLASVALTLMREATGREDPIEPLRPVRAAALARTARVAFWSLAAGCGASTTAALVAHRSAGAGGPPLLIDLDRIAPSLALRAHIEGATIVDLLVQPGRESDLVSRWASVPFVPGSLALRTVFAGPRVAALVATLASGRAVVLDLGAGPDALDPAIVTMCTRLVVVAGTRASQLQALFAARPMLDHVSTQVALVIVGADETDARLVASRAGLALAGIVPHDDHLARDEFGARATTMRAIDALIRAL